MKLGMHSPREILLRAEYEREAASVHALLGDEVAAAAYAAGRAMTVDEAVAYALGDET